MGNNNGQTSQADILLKVLYNHQKLLAIIDLYGLNTNTLFIILLYSGMDVIHAHFPDLPKKEFDSLAVQIARQLDSCLENMGKVVSSDMTNAISSYFHNNEDAIMSDFINKLHKACNKQGGESTVYDGTPQEVAKQIMRKIKEG